MSAANQPLATPAEIAAAIQANRQEPPGRSRTVRAEALVDIADHLGDPESQIAALHALVDAYQVGGEGFRSPIPFARLLRLWDEHGNTLTRADWWSYRTHWKFKWVTSDLILVPEVPLATIRGFVGEMERRYRIAGYGMRAVHAQRFFIAEHLGDAAEAAVQHEKWLTADRDRMADCQACELSSLGEWRGGQGDDAGALDLWARTLSGQFTCDEEPGCTLSASLLPLVRLGRLDDARTHHLRGYRLIRGRENLRARVGEHILFCAMTGNEGRGVEILVDHRGWFDGPNEPWPQLSYLEAVAVLLRRIVELGSGALPLPGPGGRDWRADELRAWCEDEVGSLAARFDARNGNDAVSRRSADRLRQQPLVEVLPLGIRSVIPTAPDPARDPAPVTAATAPASAPVPAAAPVTPPTEMSGARDVDLAALTAEAFRLLRIAHPDGAKTWDRVQRTAEAQGVTLDPKTEAGFWEQAGMTAAGAKDWQAAVNCAVRAAELLTGEGERGAALGLLSRAVFSETLANGSPSPEIDARLENLYVEVRQLVEAGDAEVGNLVMVCHSLAANARIAAVHAYPDADAAAAAEAAYAEAVDRLRSLGEEYGLPHRVAAARHMRSGILFGEGRTEEAAVELAAATAGYEAAGRPWSAMHTRLALAQVYERAGHMHDAAYFTQAEAQALEALTASADWPTEQFPTGVAYLLLAAVTGALDRHEDSARHGAMAASWGDRNADPELAASARYNLAQSYEHLRRHADTAAILESALPEIAEHLDEAAVVQARRVLARALGQLGDHRGAAEQYAVAAAIAETWPHQRAHAVVAADAAHALGAAGLTAEAQLAFEKAIWLLRSLDGTEVLLARTLRALAWSIFNESGESGDSGESGEGAAEKGAEVVQARSEALDRALLLFADADQVLEQAVTDGRDETGEIAFERAETNDQLARLHLEAELPERALPYSEKAAAGFRALLPARAFDYDIAEQMSAWLLNRFNQHDAAVARLERALAAGAAFSVELPHCDSYLKQLRG